jgi:hypothetical protein
MIVKVQFSNVVIGAVSNGITTPVGSFILNGWRFEIDTNGIFYPDEYVGGGVSSMKWVDKDGGRWTITADSNGVFNKQLEGYFGDLPTFLLSVDVGMVVWIIGIDTNGNFEPRYLD